jgi:hypothetical protein
MKHCFFVLGLLAVCCGFSYAQQAPPHTAFYDARVVNWTRTHSGDLVSNLDSCKKIAQYILPYLKDAKGGFEKALTTGFSADIVAAVNQYLARIDTVSMGNYLVGAWRAQQPLVYRVDLAAYTNTVKNYDPVQKRENALIVQLDAFKYGKPYPNKTTFFHLMDSLNRAYPAPGDSLLLLTAANIKTVHIFADSLGKLQRYKSAYDGLVILKHQLKACADSIFVPFKDDNVKFRYFTQLAHNPVLSPGIANNLQAPDVAPVHTAAVTDNQTGALTSFKLPTESELVDALAIYMVGRFKQDVVLTFVTALRQYAIKQPLLTDMFPNTFKLLNEYPDYEIPRFGKLWSHAVAEDLSHIPQDVLHGDYLKNRPNILNNPKFQVFNDIIAIGEQVALKTSFPDMISYFSANPDELKCPQIIQVFGLLRMIDQEFVDAKDKTKFWIDWTQLSQMPADEQALCFGLLANSYQDVFKSFNINFDVTGTDFQKNILALRNYFSKALVILNSFQAAKATYLDKLGKDPNAIYSGINFWDMQLDLLKTLESSPIISGDKVKIDQFLDVAGAGLAIYKEIENKDYAAMVHESIDLISKIVPNQQAYTNLLLNNWRLTKEKFLQPYQLISPELDEIDRIISERPYMQALAMQKLDSLSEVIYQHYTGLNTRLLVYNTAAAFKTELTVLYNAHLNPNTVSLHPQPSQFYYIAKFAEFFTDMLSAKNNQDMASVISTYAAPPNSFKIKRSTRASISLNSYIGTYVGGEFAPALKPVFGLSAPIGLSFNWGFQRSTTIVDGSTFIGANQEQKQLTGGSFSINLSVIDIGAVVSYRINNGDEGALPQSVNFGQFLAPGLSFSFGLKNVPLCFAVGTELTPQLRNISTSSQAQPAIRIYGGLFYDLPLVNISKR